MGQKTMTGTHFVLINDPQASRLVGQAPGSNGRPGVQGKHTRLRLWGNVVKERVIPTRDEHVYPGALGMGNIDQQGAEKETMGTQTSDESPIVPVSEDIGAANRNQVARPQRTVRRPVWQEDFVIL